MKKIFKNKVVFITGASGNIGLAISKNFITNGAKVILQYNKGNNDFKLEKIDKNSIILRTSLDNALNTLRKMNLNESGLKHITKQSNLVRYFNA